MASPFLRLNGLEGFLSLSSAAGRRDLGRIERDLRGFMPHLQRAAQLRSRLLDLREQADLQAFALDRLQIPVLVAASDRTVLLANQLGQQWLQTSNNPFAGANRQATILKNE